MKKILFSSVTILLYCFLTISVYAATPLWTIEVANGSAVKVVPANGITTIAYVVQNQSNKPKHLIMLPIPGITQTPPCHLKPKGIAGSSCLLELTINGSLLSATGIHGGPVICSANADGSANLNQCYQPSLAHILNISKGEQSSIINLTAVGFYANGSLAAPLTYTSPDTGITWNLSTVLPPAEGSGDNVLYSSSCNANGNCVAAGYYVNNSLQHPLTFVSTNYGVQWSPSPSMPADLGVFNTQLRGVSCPDASHCITVGSTSSGIAAIYISNNNGNSWANIPIQTQNGDELLSVSCLADGHCIAVGDNQTTGTILSYSSIDFGVNWARSVTIENGLLNSAYCNTFGNCVAVGGILDSSLNFVPVSYYSTDYGVTWQLSITQPSLPASGNSFLYSVSCNQSGQCATVGGSNTIPMSFISNDFGVNWTTSSALFTFIGNLITVFCNDTGNCAAIGNSIASLTLSFVSTDAGDNWQEAAQIMPTPAPGNIVYGMSGY